MIEKWNLSGDVHNKNFGTLWDLVWYLEHNTSMHGNQPISFRGINNKDRKIVSCTWDNGFHKFIKRQVRKESVCVIYVYDMPNKRHIEFTIRKRS